MIRLSAFALLLVALNAQADGDTLVERIDLNGLPSTASAASTPSLRITQSLTEPLATAGPLLPQDALRGAGPDTARQTMFWADHARSGLGFGVGVEQRGLDGLQAGQPQMNGGMLMGLSLVTSERSRLTVETPLISASRSEPYIRDDPRMMFNGPRQVRIGLTFNTRKPIISDLRRGVRMELSGQATMAVKLRGGRLGFAFQKSW